METTVAIDPKVDAVRDLCRTVAYECDRHTIAARNRERKAIKSALTILLGRKPTNEEVEYVHDYF